MRTNRQRQNQGSQNEQTQVRFFLLRTLAAVFAAQFVVMAIALNKCGSVRECPKIGERIENLFNVAIATTLSLLSGAQIK